jgi:hypothetical protein
MRIEDFTHPDPSNEMSLLLACLRVSPTDADLEKIYKLSQKNIEWKNFIRLTQFHRVAPLDYAGFYHAGPRHVHEVCTDGAVR